MRPCARLSLCVLLSLSSQMYPSSHSIAPSLCSRACSLLLSPCFPSLSVYLGPSLFPSQFVIDPAAPSPWQQRRQAFLLPRLFSACQVPARGGLESRSPLRSTWLCCLAFSRIPKRGSLNGSHLLDLRRLRSGWRKVSAVHWWEEIKDSWVQGGWAMGTWVPSLLGLCHAHMKSCCRLPGAVAGAGAVLRLGHLDRPQRQATRTLTSQC